MKDGTVGAVFVMAYSLFLIVVWCFVGRTIGVREMRTEAVQQGYAEWVPDESGDTEFRWKEAE